MYATAAKTLSRSGPLVPVCVAALTILPIFIFGLHNGPDLSQHIRFASTFYHAILQGDFYPSWSSEENFGYGSSGLRFYPPLFQFLLGLARLVTGDWHWAICGVLLIFSVTGVCGVYLWAKEFVSETEAALASSVFALMPYHLSQIYTSSFYAQFCAIVVIPFAFLFVTKICRNGQLAHIFGLGISLSIVILTNLPAAMIGCFGLLVYSLAMLKRQSFAATTAKLGVGVIITLLATAFYWLRMYPELELSRSTLFWLDQTFDFREHFLLTQPSKVVFGIWFNNHTLITTIFVALCGLVGRASLTEQKPKIRAVIILFFFSVFMTTPLSTPLWVYLPYLNEVQFAWRWQTITSLSAAVIFATGAFSFIKGVQNAFSLKNPRVWLSVLTVIAIVTVFYQLSSRYYKHRIPADEFNTWSENNINSLGYEYFWTPQTRKEAFAISDKVVAVGREAGIIEWNGGERRFHLAEGRAASVRVATLYYPHWRAMVNGTAVELSPADDGAMFVPVPAEESEVRLWFQEPWYVQMANYFSGLVWLMLLLAAAYFLFIKLRRPVNS